MKALRLYAGPQARAHLEHHGLSPQHVGAVPAAAGGPKGLVLGPLDRFVFGEWLPQSQQTVHLIGASIGAWRMATACLQNNVSALHGLERDYIAQHFEPPEGAARPEASQVSAQFRQGLEAFYGGRVQEVLAQPRYRLHIIASRGKSLLARDGAWRTPLGYGAAYVANALRRSALSAFIDRVVFSGGAQAEQWPLPFGTQDFLTHRATLTPANFMDALQASCSIPFYLTPLHNIAGAPPGAYWDGGITDYHLHLPYQLPAHSPIVLYPHFQRAVVPGWLDKAWKRRHAATPALAAMLVVAPDPEWVKTLPNGRLPDRSDFTHYGRDFAGRTAAWRGATAAAQQLADEFAQWLEKPDLSQVEAL